jgi:hypothetical protein
MADHMGEMIRDYLGEVEQLPASNDPAAIRALEARVLSHMATQGFDQSDIEQQLGRIRDIILAEILRRAP